MSAPTFPWRESGVRWLWLAVAVIVLDQLTKWWISTHLAISTPYKTGDVIDVLPVLNIIYTTNTGAAWSFGADQDWGRWLFTSLAVVVSVVLVYWVRRLTLSTQRLLIAGLTLILGGAIGNVLDRLRLGHVVDFAQAHWNNSYFPAFNVADSAISIGAVFIVLDAFRESQRERRAKAKAAETDS
jgi:signal peptidase II